MWNHQLQCPIMTKCTVHSNLDGLIINDHVLSDAGLRKNEPLLEHPNSKKLRSQHPGARRTLKKTPPEGDFERWDWIPLDPGWPETAQETIARDT